jgi:hypothetical protein
MGFKLLVGLFMIALIAFPMFISGCEFPDSFSYAGLSGKKDPAKILREIYREVKELGQFPGDDFIKREFFVGKDDDDTYQDIHVLVLIQNIDDKERLTIQVTYMQPSENNPIVKYAKDVKTILCLIGGDNIDIVKSEYDEKEHKKILPDILRAIRGKKKLLKK